MKLLPRSAAKRIALVGFITYSAAVLLLGIAVSYTTHSALTKQIDAGISQTTATLTAEYRTQGAQGINKAMAQSPANSPISLGVAVLTPDAHRIAGNLDTALPTPGWQKIKFYDALEGADSARAKVTQLPDGNRLIVAADLEAVEAIDRTLFSMFTVTLIALLGIGLGGAFGLALYLQRRLGSIETTAQSVISGNLQERAPVGPHDDEFDRVAKSLNTMLDKITELITNLRQISADVAHDLRTPLTGLRNQLEVLMHASNEATRAELVDAALVRTDHILALFSAILRISEIDSGELRKAFKWLDASALVSDIGETLAPLAEDCGKTLTVDAKLTARIHGHRELLTQAVINLVENALLHTPVHTQVVLSVSQLGQHTAIRVQDNGPGIPASDFMRAKQRFVRLDPARGTPGHGLGLSLACSVAHAHDGYLTLEDAGPGLVATLCLPAKPSA